MPFTLTMPKLSPTMEEGTVVKWHKQVGEFVEAGELLIEVATDKATVEYNVLDQGWLRQILVAEGKEAKVNQPIAIFTEEKETSLEGYQPEGMSQEPAAPTTVVSQSRVPEVPVTSQLTTISPSKGDRVRASPLAKKLAKEKGLDLSSVQGTGPGGRVVSRDLEKAQVVGVGQRARSNIPAGTYEEVPLSPLRKVIAQRLQEAKTYIPHFYVTQTIDAGPLASLREQLKHHEIKISVNDLIVRACALTLRDHPVINSGFNPTNQTIIQFKTVDIAIAVSLEGGLITPIVRHADYKTVGELAQEIRQLAQKAREGRLEGHEYKGGSFTISNMGMYGVTEFQAILNAPQAAILAVSAIHDVPVVKNGSVVPGQTMNLTLSVDHRVVDGVAAALFLKSLKEILEYPAPLLMG